MLSKSIFPRHRRVGFFNGSFSHSLAFSLSFALSHVPRAGIRKTHISLGSRSWKAKAAGSSVTSTSHQLLRLRNACGASSLGDGILVKGFRVVLDRISFWDAKFVLAIDATEKT